MISIGYRNRKKLLTVIGILTIAVVVIITVHELLKPKTPIELAEMQSGLILPDDMNLIKFDDPQFFNGDIFRTIEFSLTDKQIKYIEIQCRKNNYKKLPVEKAGYGPKELDDYDTGYYLLKIIPADQKSYEMTILDIARRRFYLISIQ